MACLTGPWCELSLAPMSPPSLVAMTCLVSVSLWQMLLEPALFPGHSPLHAKRQITEKTCDDA